jgi:hypothetical protein
MSFKWQVLQETIPNSTGNQTISTSFQAVGLRSQYSILSSTGTANDACLGLGWCDNSLNQVAFCARAKQALGASVTAYKRQNITNFITIVDDTGTVIAEGSVTSITSSTFVIDWTTISAAGQGLAFTVDVWGGSDCTGTCLALSQSPTTATTANVTINSGVPVVVFASAIARTSNATSTNGGGEADLYLGWATSTSARACSSWQVLAGNPVYAATMQRTDHIICAATAALSPTTYLLADVSAITSGQVTYSWSNVDSTAGGTLLATFAMYGTFQAEAFSNTMPGSTGNQANGLSFTPSGAIIQSNGVSASTSAKTAQSNSIGSYDGSTNQVMTAILNSGVAGTTNAQNASAYGSANTVQVWTHGTTPTKDQEAAVNSLSAGAQLNFTTVDSNAEQYIGLAMGSAAGVPGAPTGLTVASDPTNPTTALDLSWSAGTGSPTSYDIQRSPTKGGTFSTLATGVTGTTYTDSSLTPGSEYAYQVAGVNGSGVGSYCSPVAWSTQPAPPTGLSETVMSANSIAVSFTPPTVGSNIAINQYQYRYETPVGAGNWAPGSSPSYGNASSGPFTISGLSPLTQYGIEVATNIGSTNGDWSNSGGLIGPWSSELIVITPPMPRGFNVAASGPLGAF